MSVVLGIVYAVVGLITLGLVLLHSGRGGGLSDMFGGGLGASAAGSTSVERNLDRLTIFFSLVFTMLTVALVLFMDPSQGSVDVAEDTTTDITQSTDTSQAEN